MSSLKSESFEAHSRDSASLEDILGSAPSTSSRVGKTVRLETSPSLRRAGTLNRSRSLVRSSHRHHFFKQPPDARSEADLLSFDEMFMNTHALADVTRTARLQLARIASLQILERGDVLCEGGTPMDRVYFILEGSLDFVPVAPNGVDLDEDTCTLQARSSLGTLLTQPPVPPRKPGEAPSLARSDSLSSNTETVAENIHWGGRAVATCRTEVASVTQQQWRAIVQVVPSWNASQLCLFLEDLPLFGQLSQEQMFEVARVARVRMCHSGSVVYHQGSGGDEVYVVRRGFVKLLRELPVASTDRRRINQLTHTVEGLQQNITTLTSPRKAAGRPMTCPEPYTSGSEDCGGTSHRPPGFVAGSPRQLRGCQSNPPPTHPYYSYVVHGSMDDPFGGNIFGPPSFETTVTQEQYDAALAGLPPACIPAAPVYDEHGYKIQDGYEDTMLKLTIRVPMDDDTVGKDTHTSPNGAASDTPRRRAMLAGHQQNNTAVAAAHPVSPNHSPSRSRKHAPALEIPRSPSELRSSNSYSKSNDHMHMYLVRSTTYKLVGRAVARQAAQENPGYAEDSSASQSGSGSDPRSTSPKASRKGTRPSQGLAASPAAKQVFGSVFKQGPDSRAGKISPMAGPSSVGAADRLLNTLKQKRFANNSFNFGNILTRSSSSFRAQTARGQTPPRNSASQQPFLTPRTGLESGVGKGSFVSPRTILTSMSLSKKNTADSLNLSQASSLTSDAFQPQNAWDEFQCGTPRKLLSSAQAMHLDMGLLGPGRFFGEGVKGNKAGCRLVTAVCDTHVELIYFVQEEVEVHLDKLLDHLWNQEPMDSYPLLSDQEIKTQLEKTMKWEVYKKQLLKEVYVQKKAKVDTLLCKPV